MNKVMRHHFFLYITLKIEFFTKIHFTTVKESFGVSNLAELEK